MKKVVIIGGGWAGLSLVSQISRYNNTPVHITVVDKNDFFEVTPYALKFMAVPDEFKSSHVKYEELKAKYEEKGHIVQFLKHSQAISLDTESNSVLVQTSARGNEKQEEEISTVSLKFDYLVLASGGIYRVPYVRPKANSLPTAESRYLELQQFQTKIKSSSNYHVVVVGGGALAIELVGELVEMNKNLPNPFRITMIHSHLHLFPSVRSESNHRYIMRFMQNNNVNVLLGYRAHIEDDSPDLLTNPEIKKRVTVSSNVQGELGGEKELDEANMVFWCSGFKPATDWLSGSNLLLDEQTKAVKVDSFLRCINYDNIFAIGDVNDIPVYKDVRNAYDQATTVAKSIMTLIERGYPVEYKQRCLKPVAYTLGNKDGSILLNGWTIMWGRITAFMMVGGRDRMLAMLKYP